MYDKQEKILELTFNGEKIINSEKSLQIKCNGFNTTDPCESTITCKAHPKMLRKSQSVTVFLRITFTWQRKSRTEFG